MPAWSCSNTTCTHTHTIVPVQYSQPCPYSNGPRRHTTGHVPFSTSSLSPSTLYLQTDMYTNRLNNRPHCSGFQQMVNDKPPTQAFSSHHQHTHMNTIQTSVPANTNEQKTTFEPESHMRVPMHTFLSAPFSKHIHPNLPRPFQESPCLSPKCSQL
jgi:hypothetical protein